MKLGELDIARLLPAFMRESPDNVALADGLSEVLQAIAAQSPKLSTWGHLADMPTAELDELADELAIFWYDRSLTYEQKRALIANSDQVYMKLGTASAVEQVVSDIFGGAEVEEWFEYDGRPHYFRIRVDNAAGMTPENEAKMLRVLGKVKRVGEWLESIRHEAAASIPLSVGMTVAIHDETAVIFNVWRDETEAALHAGIDLQGDQSGPESPTISTP